MLRPFARSTRRARRRALSLAPRAFASAAQSSTSQTSGLRVGVVGLGAIGSIFFTQLSRETLRCGATASPLVRSVEAFVKPHHLAQLVQRPSIALSHPGSDSGGDSAFATISLKAKHGDLVAGADDVVRIRTLNGVHHESEPPLDVVLVALKAYDSARAIQELQARHAHRFDRDAVVVLLQNGLGALPSQEASTTSSAPIDSRHYVNGVTFVGGRVRSMGQVVVSGLETEPTYFAPVNQPTKASVDRSHIVSEKLRMLSEALAKSGLRSEVLTTNEMQTILWRKLIVNAAINPVAALLNVPNGSVGACEWSRRCVDAVVREAVEIAQREQVDLQATEQEMVEYVLRVAVNTKANVCSTLADLRKGARTEIDAITGQLLHFGHKHGVPTPTNALLFDLVKALEAQQLRAERGGSI